MRVGSKVASKEHSKVDLKAVHSVDHWELHSADSKVAHLEPYLVEHWAASKALL
jgi:hypothetical protein